MIVQHRPDGSVILINQSDHAKLSGLFAAHWGNGAFAVPRPFDSCVRAAMFHDAGWYAYETGARLTPEMKPMGFTQVPLDDATLSAYQWATDWMIGIDPYAGALMRKHRNGLWLGRYDAITHPAMFGNRTMTDALNAFVDRNEIARKREESTLDAAEFAVNYALLQVWDLLSLNLCMREPRADYIAPVPTGYRGEASSIVSSSGAQFPVASSSVVRDATEKGRAVRDAMAEASIVSSSEAAAGGVVRGAMADSSVRMDLTPLGAGKLALAPYPFDVERLPVGIVHRHLPTSTFASEAEFRRAWFAAPLRMLEYEFVPG